MYTTLFYFRPDESHKAYYYYNIFFLNNYLDTWCKDWNSNIRGILPIKKRTVEM